MERISNKSPASVNHEEFHEDGNDSDLEGRLYAEIYYSNENQETGENFEDNCMKSIQEIKNASYSSIQSSLKPIQNNLSKNIENPSNSIAKNCSPRNDEINSEFVDNEEQFLRQLDKNINLDKPVNLESESAYVPSGVSNEIVNENLNLQEKPDRNLNSQQEESRKYLPSEMMNGEIQNCSPRSKNGQDQKDMNRKKKDTQDSSQALNNSLITPKSRKRTSGIEKDSGSKSKKRSLESYKSANVELNEIPLNPVCLNGRKSRAEANNFPLLSDGAMGILFPEGWKENKRKESVGKKKKERDKKKIKSTNLNNEQIQKSAQRTQEEEVIEISSSDSSNDNFDMVISSREIAQEEREKQSEENRKRMPMWLDVCSDSDESVVEVPVPPKPQPPLVDLKDSDRDSSDSDNSSSDGIYDLKSINSKKKLEKVKNISNVNSTSDSEESLEESSRGNLKESLRENATVKSVENTEVNSIKNSEVNSVENSEENSRSRLLSEQSNSTDETSDSSYSNFSTNTNLILNCTKVQKGASSLEEIKEMRKTAGSSKVDDETCRIINESGAKYKEYVLSLNDKREDVEPAFLNAGPSTSIATGVSANIKRKSHKKHKRVKNQKTSKEKTDEEYFFEPMLDKIREFYDNSWGGEDFSVEETQKQMSKDPRRWAILDEDWKPSLLKRQRYFLSKMKCNLCRQSGHLRANCPEPKKAPVCHMCGSQGHYETRCPHKICLTCGKKQNTYRQTCESCEKLFCMLCRSRGHIKDTCPDLWRQYHHTTSETEHQPPKNSNEVMKPSNFLNCCNCSMRGHDSSTCKKYRWSQHYPTPPHVKNYTICSQMTPNVSSNQVEVINLTESSGESSQCLNKVIEPGSVIEKNTSQIPESDNAIESNSKSAKVKIIFEQKIKKPPKVAKFKNKDCFNQKHKERIVLSGVRSADIEVLIADKVTPKFFSHLSKILRCDICITLVEDSNVEMNITYYILFSQRYVLKKIIYHWLRLSNEDKKKIQYKMLRMDKKKLTNVLDKKFEELDNTSGSIKNLYASVKADMTWLKQNENKSWDNNFCKRKKGLEANMSKLVMLLYKHDCAFEKEALSKFRKMFTTLQKKKGVSLDAYIWILYYYNLIFGLYTPPNLQQMVNNYSALREGKANTSLSNSDDQENVEQENVSQEHIDQNNSLLNKHASSTPSSLKINSPSFSLQLHSNQSTFVAGCSNTPQKSNRHFNKFPFPAQDFIPISNNELNKANPKRKKQDSRQYGRNPMRNLKKFDPKVPQTNERLVQEASHLMNQALQINLPHVTKAGIRVGDLINENKLQRKHINHLKHLINQQKRGVS